MLKKIGLFATPDSTKSLEDYCLNFSNSQERLVATTVMGMTWNLCAKLTDNAIDMNAAQLAMYLDRGLELTVSPLKRADFNLWMCKAGDIEKTQALLNLAAKLDDVALLGDDSPIDWITVCYEIVENNLAISIAEMFSTGIGYDEDLIILKFQELMNEFIAAENAGD
jgi:hypothetical protein